MKVQSIWRKWPAITNNLHSYLRNKDLVNNAAKSLADNLYGFDEQEDEHDDDGDDGDDDDDGDRDGNHRNLEDEDSNPSFIGSNHDESAL
eukprot:CAMPEP_0116886240 /NCGR_PEP_ID=MMETSP0463-20121206/19970_1 /TAXON_ID=181622 /ORGANISM="Strombidinopsis sp, Strain SopsisLIS2011" /LENGTH=89 /DNA_ID=CAMNT_0004546223 /DNA_START=991 /DNA_END=1259 /DNA_ORIENTATION=-